MGTSSAGRQIRLLLWIGFGGLIALLCFTGASALSIVRQVQVRNERIRQNFLERTRILEQLRSDIYLSGTYVRDFLLETDDAAAESYRRDFRRNRARIEDAMDRYRQVLHPGETGVFNYFERELTGYFGALQPALEWTAEQRKTSGRAFMRNEVLRRRTTMITLADQVGRVNQRQLENGTALVRQLFAEFRSRMVTLLVLTLLIGVLLAGASMYRILELERETEKRYQEVVQARRESQDLSAKLVDAQEQERRSISRELHDEVGQSLSALLVGVGNVSRAVAPSGDTEVQQQMQLIRSLAERCVSVVRNMSLLLRPSMLDDLGLLPALQWQAREVSRTTGLRVSVASHEVPESLPEEYKTCIYRVVQEALHNAQRHADARHVRIELQQRDGELALSIQDDGRGFRPENRGLGLLGMEERVTRLCGRFGIHSEAGQGTLLSIELPLPRKSC